jgi:serine/threonine protein kinase
VFVLDDIQNPTMDLLLSPVLASPENENGIFTAILRGQLDLSSEPWPHISPGAKDLVKKMLNINPKERLTAFQVLSKYPDRCCHTLI